MWAGLWWAGDDVEGLVGGGGGGGEGEESGGGGGKAVPGKGRGAPIGGGVVVFTKRQADHPCRKPWFL